MKKLLTYLFVFLIVHAASAFGADSEITIAGDPCSVPLAEKLGAAFVAKNPEVKVTVKSHPCMQGVYLAAEGAFTMGVSTQNGLSENLPQGAYNTVIAKSPIVLVVNKNNPINNITSAQLKGIFSGKIKNWKELGGNDIEIKSVMIEPCVKYTMGKRVAPYGEVSELRPEGKVNPVLYTNKLVSENEGAVGQQIYGYEDGVKTLTIDNNLPDMNPETYGFYQDYNIVTKGKPGGIAKEYIEFALSPEGGKIISAIKHVPLKN
ncbi:MAG: substrate-binding domain-containing protein [Thermodesulfobacteriota bacterium]